MLLPLLTLDEVRAELAQSRNPVRPPPPRQLLETIELALIERHHQFPEQPVRDSVGVRECEQQLPALAAELRLQ